MERHDDFEAVGMLQALYESGHSVYFLPSKIRYFNVLLMTDRGDEAMEVLKEVHDVLKKELNVSVEECKRLSKSFSKKQKYLTSILFDLVGNLLLSDLNNDDRILRALVSNMTCIHTNMQEVVKKCNCKETMQLHVVPVIRDSLTAALAKIKGKTSKDFAMLQVKFRHILELIEGEVEDLDAAEITLTESKSIMEDAFGDEANSIQLFGTVLNNLAATYMRQRRLEKARSAFEKARNVFQNVQNYESEEERQNDIIRSSKAIDRINELMQ